MSEFNNETSREKRLALGLADEPAILDAALWLTNDKPVADYTPEYQNLLRYMEATYGVEREVVETAIEIAEQRLINRMGDA
jgi:hypothetical protein